MIDWFTGVVSYDASGLRPDLIYRVDRDGNIVWETECWIECEGSYSDKIRIRRKAIDQQLRLWVPDDQADILLARDFLQLSGNPSKFLQGHNAFGVSVTELEPMVKAAICALPAEIRPVDAGSLDLPHIQRSRVDTAVMVEMGSHRDVHLWLNGIASASRSRHGRALVSGDTVYWGKHSRRWTLKAYCKFCEMAEHKHSDLKINDMLREFVHGQLRLELTLRSMELKKYPTLNESLVWDYFNKVEKGVLEITKMDAIEVLPLSTQAVVMKWIQGDDPRNSLRRRNFYRHRRLILDNLGVDISLPKKDQAELGDHVSFDSAFLRSHEVNVVPESLRGLLYIPDHGFAFSAS